MNKEFENIETRKLDFNNKEQAKEIIRRFTFEYLNNDINNLKDFSFWHIAGNPSFDGTCFSNSLKDFDGDHTRLAYAIDKLLYGDLQIPDFILGQTYKGDTINTFRTLFGNRFLYKENGETKVENEFKFNEEEKQKRNAFFYKYQTVGNFYVLPSETILYGLKNQSINSYRGSVSNWKDYFDVFLGKLETCLKNTDVYNSDEKFLQKLLQKEGCNKKFFSEFCKGNVDKFLETFRLGMYSSQLYNHHGNQYLGYRYYDGDIKVYKEFAFNYVDIATELIDERSIIIVDQLKDHLK